MKKPHLTKKQLLKSHILDLGYCDNRAYSKTLPRFWSVLYKCPKCGEISHYAKELTLVRAIQFANEQKDCQECD